MVSKVNAKHFFFHGQLNILWERLDIRQLAADGLSIHGFRCSLEKRHLALDVFLGGVLSRLYQSFVDGKHCRPVIRKAVAGAGFYQTFYCFLVYLGNIQVADKGENVRCRAFFLPCLDYGIDSALTHILDSQQTEADFTVFYAELLIAGRNARRQNLNAHVAAISDIS